MKWILQQLGAQQRNNPVRHANHLSWFEPFVGIILPCAVWQNAHTRSDAVVADVHRARWIGAAHNPLDFASGSVAEGTTSGCHLTLAANTMRSDWSTVENTRRSKSHLKAVTK